MNVTTLREKYCLLEPEERARLFLSKAVPKRDDALADALEPGSLLDRYLMDKTERIMIFFGAYWLSKLCWFEGFNSGIVLSECIVSSERETQAAISEKYEKLGDNAAALALALHEFDEEQGGWLNGVAAIMDCRDQWDRALGRGKMLQEKEIEPHFQDRVASCRHEVHAFWTMIENCSGS